MPSEFTHTPPIGGDAGSVMGVGIGTSWKPSGLAATLSTSNSKYVMLLGEVPIVTSKVAVKSLRNWSRAVPVDCRLTLANTLICESTDRVFALVQPVVLSASSTGRSGGSSAICACAIGISEAPIPNPRWCDALFHGNVRP